MNKYEVVAEMGYGPNVLRVVEAESEKQARKIMWEQCMSEGERDSCEDIEVFPFEG